MLTPPNDELVLTGFVRRMLTGSQWGQALVSNRLPSDSDGDEVAPDEPFAVIIRSDGGPALDPPTFLRRIGVRVFGPDGDSNGQRTSELARFVAALLGKAHEHTREVVVMRGLNGPYRVPETVGRPEVYLTCELVFVGSVIHLGKE